MPKRSTSATRNSSRSAVKVNTNQSKNVKVLTKTKKVIKSKNVKNAKSGKTGNTKISKAPIKRAATRTKSEATKPAKTQARKGKAVANTKAPKKSLSQAKNAKTPAKAAKIAPAPKQKTPKQLKPASIPSGYTADQYQKYKEEKIRISKLNNADMKAILKKNLQSMSGNKDELIEKIADGIVLGRIPRCPSCYGGRPKFDKKTGRYTCPGYRDDVEYQNCHKVFEKSDLKRDPWEA